ncbi:MAG TPA: IS1595 family transposase, partial [Acidimicrobiales bacterium]|nr:IS1595 family transposase [Acidimicrobiales bacterium]
MTKMTEKQPTNLIEAIRYFADDERCFEFMKGLRWPDGAIVCPRCGYDETSFLTTRKIWKCKGCKRQFSIKVGTIFEDSSLGFDRWLPAIWLIANSKNGISSHELGRALGVTQKTAWFMNHRIRLAMASGTFQKLSGTVEVDETYVGGLGKNMHRSERARKIHGTGGTDKVAIQGALERGGQLTAAVVDVVSSKTIQANVRAWVESGATVYTDQARTYVGLAKDFQHKSVRHSEYEYVNGDVHTNSIESFWNLYKRAWKGTYTHNAPKHTLNYVNERTFAFNNRELSDLG